MSAVLSHWIHRTVADVIYQRVTTDDGSVVVFFIEAPAGMGKTILARDIGCLLNSPTGYEPAFKGRFVWSGILDIYDPDTNNNLGIERRLINAFRASRYNFSGFEFESYQTTREQYDAWFKSGIWGAGLEEQRRKVEEAFAAGLQETSKVCRPVLVFDTIERLESASDPTQRELGFFDDTASAMGWLIYQITQLRSGVVLLLGRKAKRFYDILKNAVDQANRSRSGLSPIELEHIELSKLDAQEIKDFFANRIKLYPTLETHLTDDLKDLLASQSEGKPLLLDLALQSLLETGDPAYVRSALAGGGGIHALECALVQAYQNSFKKPERQILLYYLALARNGLFAELLRYLEPRRAEPLIAELQQMESLPFVKVREISATVPGREERIPRRAYFLHDAMYATCDEVLMKPGQVMEDSRKIAEWYDRQTDAARREAERLARRFTPDPDMLVESLFYRMRADPVAGYHWFLKLTGSLIRSARTGIDMRLHDAMGLFVASASPDTDAEPGQSLSSAIDRANVQTCMPRLFDDFRVDCASLWIERYTMRGKRNLAEEIGKKEQVWIEEAYKKNPAHYTLPYAEFLLWYGQVLMYGYDFERALKIYHQVLDLLASAYPADKLGTGKHGKALSDFESWRLNLVRGRTHNNIGYTYWMYQGKYNLAVKEFQQATRYFRSARLEEEEANSSDNLGRVYAILGEEFRSSQLIKNGLEIRKRLGLSYREALSWNSLALALIRFGETNLALRAIENALIQFRRVGVDRGIGLGLLTRGMIYRNMAEMWRDLDIPTEEALRYTDLAETDLREAVRIFSTSVKEPIREMQARNEMACCYRARYLLLASSDAPEADKELAFAQGHHGFRSAISIAQRNNYIVEELDSIQDLAVLFFRAGRYDNAEQYLLEIHKRIPASHKIQVGTGFAELGEPERVDAYYKLMGQVELLVGAIEFERGRARAREQGQAGDIPTKEALLEATRHYLLAVAYFNQYSGEPYAHRQTYQRIYKRLSVCALDMVQEMTQEHLPRWVKEYNLPDPLVRSLFRDVFGLFY